VHTKNILADPRVSLMIDERKAGDPLQGARVMLMGTAAATDDPDARRRYLERQPERKCFAGFADFAFYRITLKAAHLVAGFGRIVDLKPQDVLTETAMPRSLSRPSRDVAHMTTTMRTRCGFMRPSCSALPTGIGVAWVAIRRSRTAARPYRVAAAIPAARARAGRVAPRARAMAEEARRAA